MIVVECDPDEFLMKSMGFSRKKIKHESGKGDVLRTVRKNQNVIGIIDEDPDSTQPSEIKKFKEKETMRTVKLLVRKDDTEKKLIQISPYLEHWLLDRAKQNQISPNDFGLPEDPKEMHDITHIERNINFQNFLNELIRVDDEIDKMKRWINEVVV
jgi:hypothetical protein